VDSGGDGSGLLEFSNCWFEGILHEANSLSGTGKNVNHHHDVVLNCGQALEAGYGGPNGLLDSCLVSACMTGARFGDNYGDGRSYTGSMSATNSLLIHNYRDVWGFQWIDWNYHTERMTIEDNWLTAPLEQHPDNLVWNPESDAWRLVSYVNTPSVSPVGAGFAVHQLRDAISGIEEGMPVGLSCFTTNAVALDYVIDTPEGVLESGSVILEPGQVIAMIPAPEAVPLSTGIVRVRLTGIDGAVITGIREIWFVRAAADLIPAGSEWRYLDDGSDGGTAWRNPGYDDSSWATGPAEFGYGEGDEATVVSYGPDSNNKYVTTYFRRAFVLDNPMAINALTLRLKRDDGGIVYLNGTEVFRSNLDAGTVDYLTYAPVANDDGDTWFSMDVSPSLLVPGTNIIAVEIHQSTAGSSDLTFDCGLSATPLPYIDYDWFGEDWVLFWQDPDARLEEAPTLEGPWSSLGAPGAYTVPYGENQGFYRLMQP